MKFPSPPEKNEKLRNEGKSAYHTAIETVTFFFFFPLLTYVHVLLESRSKDKRIIIYVMLARYSNTEYTLR